MTKILITGAGGFLGWKIARNIAPDYTVYAIANKHAPVIEGVKWIPHDLSLKEGIDQIYESVTPDVVIHTAAMTNVKACETYKNVAIKLNIKGTEQIANLCEKYESYLIFTSTDLVFDGTRGNYTEDDQANPVSFYGKTKRIAEEIIQEIVSGHTIIRFSLLYGESSPHGRSFLGWMQDGFENNRKLQLFRDQIRTPLYSGDAVDIIRKLIERRGKPPQLELIHAGGPEHLSRVEIGRIFCETYNYDPSLIEETKMKEHRDIVSGAPDVSLISDKARTFLDFSPRTFREGLENIKKSHR